MTSRRRRGGEKEEKGVGEGQGATHLVLLDGGVAQEPDVVVDVEIKEGAWGGRVVEAG